MIGVANEAVHVVDMKMEYKQSQNIKLKFPDHLPGLRALFHIVRWNTGQTRFREDLELHT
jgi:hypothetical protein